jgi:hypothetical protein
MCKRYYRTILIVLTVACGLSALVTAPIVLLTAAMGFDGPESKYQVWAWIVFIVVLSIPLWFVIGAIGGWVLYLRGWLRTSLLITATPLAGATIGWLLLQSDSRRPTLEHCDDQRPPVGGHAADFFGRRSLADAMDGQGLARRGGACEART